MFHFWGFTRAACVIVIAFDSFLRTGEMLGLAPEMFSRSDAHKFAVLRLDQTKTSRRKPKAAEAICIRDPLVLRALNCVLSSAPLRLPGDRLLDMSSIQFQSLFGRAVRFFGLEHLGFKPYSIRRGGATLHFRLNGDMHRTVLRGRWLSSRSARVYIEDGLASLATLHLSHTQVSELAVFQRSFIWFLQHQLSHLRTLNLIPQRCLEV